MGRMSNMNHFDHRGRAHMVNVGQKDMTERTAVAEALVRMTRHTKEIILNQRIQKGDVLAIARLAGIMAAKRTPDLIPLCHPIPITAVEVHLEFLEDVPEQERASSVLRIVGTVQTVYRTGVEMEALTVCSTAALTVYDMCKAVDRSMSIESLRLLEKSGGTSGTYQFGEDSSIADS